ncbi:MAG: aminomethyltransferase family protein [Halioglobus sp.]
MSNSIHQSVLSSFVSRHSNFNPEQYIANTASDEYDIWNGFCLPMDYGDVASEYRAIRESCAMFDVSPMKKYCLRGADAGQFLDRVLTAPVSQLQTMHSAYGLLCNEQGYLLDDGIVNKLSDDDYSLFLSELNLDDHFAQYNDFANLTITIETEKQAGLAIQGPRSCEVLQQFAFDKIEHLEPFELAYYKLAGHSILVGRLGFTGDLGYELWFKPAAISAIEDAFLRAEKSLGFAIPGYALSALQIARIEAGLIVPGWDTAGTFVNPDNERTPYELTLGWNVKLNREEPFAGKKALAAFKESGARYKMKGFRIAEQCKLQDGQCLLAHIDGATTQVGTLPSVAWHTGEHQWIGFASLSIDYAMIENAFILIDDRKICCSLCPLPMINLEHRNQVPAPAGGTESSGVR